MCAKKTEKGIPAKVEKSGLDKYNFLLESYTGGVLIIDKEWRYLTMNDAVADMVMMPKNELIGFKMTELFPGIEKTTFGKTYSKVLETGVYESSFDEFTHPDGRTVWYEVQVYPIPEGLIIMVNDISQQKQTEKDLLRYEYMIANSQDMQALLDKNYIYLAANEAYLNAFDLRKEELIGKTTSEIFGKELFAEVIKVNADKCMAGKEVHYYKWFELPKLGKKYLEIFYLPYLSGSKEILGFMVNARDITDRKKADEAAIDLRQQNELLLIAAGEGIYGLDLNGDTTFVNPAAARMIGWDPEELIGLNQHKVLHHSKPDGSPYPSGTCPIYAAYKDGNIHKVDDEVFWRKDGSSFPVEYISSPIYNKEGEIEGAVVTFKDITERKRTEEELTKHREQLEALVSERTEELEIKNKKLENAMKVFVGRELKIRDLEKKVKELGDQ